MDYKKHMTQEEQLDYLAGFFDAEGCVYVSGKGRQQQVMYSVGQNDPSVLYLLQKTFGGSVRKRAEATDKHKEQWLWQKTCVSLDDFCFLMKGRTVIKRRQILLAMKFSDTLIRIGRRYLTEFIIEKRESIGKTLRILKGKMFDREDVTVPEMPIAYWAGLFDGDGSAGLRKSKRCFYPKASIFSSYGPILEAAKHQFGGNIFENKTKRAREWRVLNGGAEEFLRQIEPYVIAKANVVRSVLALRDLLRTSRTLMICDARGQNRRFPNHVILQMESIVADIRDMNRPGPRRLRA